MMDELLEEMIEPAPTRQDAGRRRRLWATGSVLALAAVGVTSLTTSALFTGAGSLRNLRMYKKAGYRPRGEQAPGVVRLTKRIR